VHVPAPIVGAHVAERGADAALRGDGVAARRKYLAQASRRESLLREPERGAQARAARSDDDHVVGVIDELVFFGHFLKIQTRFGARRTRPQSSTRRVRAST